MSFASGYRGVAGGSVQTAVTDQPGIAVPGMLAFASDLNYCDGLYVGETNGVAAGKGIAVTDVSDDISYQRPNLSINLPADAATKAAFAGIVVFMENMQSDENGVPGWAKGRIAQVARPGRAGARIYVKAVEAVDHTADSVNWVTVAGTDGLYEKGEFAPAALAGTAAAGTSVAIDATVARWVTSAPAGGVACIELLATA